MRNESYAEGKARRKVEAEDALYNVTMELASKVGLEAPPRHLFDDFDTGMQVADRVLQAGLAKLSNSKQEGGD